MKQRHLLYLLYSFVFLSLLCSSAMAWNATGHRLIASMAWQQLNAPTRDEITHLLREHPDYAHWIARARDDDTARAAFVEASTWADDIRDNPRDTRFYDDAHHAPSPLLAGFADMAQHRNWHYVNLPISGIAPSRIKRGELDIQIPRLITQLSAPSLERRYALVWLIHLIGEAHQPLHVSMRMNPDGTWDRLGTNCQTIYPHDAHKTRSLHSFWDQLGGKSGLRGEALHALAAHLLAHNMAPSAHSDSAEWIQESLHIARQAAYPANCFTAETPLHLDDDFVHNAQKIAEQRLVFAAARLVSTLNGAFTDTKISHQP